MSSSTMYESLTSRGACNREGGLEAELWDVGEPYLPQVVNADEIRGVNDLQGRGSTSLTSPSSSSSSSLSSPFVGNVVVSSAYALRG